MQETSETTVFIVFPAFSALLKNNEKTIKFASIFLSFSMLKSLKNQPENGMNFGTLSEPTFFQIFIAFWLQIGPQNRPKIHEKSERKRKLSIGDRIEKLMKKTSVRAIREIWAGGGSALINSRGADAERSLIALEHTTMCLLRNGTWRIYFILIKKKTKKNPLEELS